MRSFITLLFLVGFFALASAQDIGKIDSRAKDVALVQLLSSPSKYNQQGIRVFGIYYWSRDGSFLFLTREHYEAFDTASALELAVGEQYLPTTHKTAESLKGRSVFLEGKFEATRGISGGPILLPITRILVGGTASGPPAELQPKSGH